MNVEELKKIQARVIKRNNLCNILGIILFLFSLVFLGSLFMLDKNNLEIHFMLMLLIFDIFFCVVITTITKFIVNGNDTKIFSEKFKSIFVLKTLNSFFDDLVYDANNGFTCDFVKNIGMIDLGDNFYSNDYISGKYKNIKFEQADMHIQEKDEEKDDDGETKDVWETIFLGRLMVFDFNKKFKANIQVVGNYFRASSLPLNKKFSRVKMEDVEFNNKFYVYTENEHEAFYILTPHFMEKIKNITNKLNCGVMFCFIDNKLYIAVDNSIDAFEGNIYKEINEKEIEENISKDIKLITDFVDDLNLDNDLFKEVM